MPSPRLAAQHRKIESNREASFCTRQNPRSVTECAVRSDGCPGVLQPIACAAVMACAGRANRWDAGRAGGGPSQGSGVRESGVGFKRFKPSLSDQKADATCTTRDSGLRRSASRDSTSAPPTTAPAPATCEPCIASRSPWPWRWPPWASRMRAWPHQALNTRCVAHGARPRLKTARQAGAFTQLWLCLANVRASNAPVRRAQTKSVGSPAVTRTGVDGEVSTNAPAVRLPY